MSSRRSIANCPVCAELPPKMNFEDCEPSPEKAPDFPELERLKLALVLSREGDHEELSVARLLKCAECGTFYYYSRYELESHFPDHGGRIALSLRRLDPVGAMDLLQGLGRTPAPEARLVQDFANRGATTPRPFTVDPADEAKRAAAQAEIEDFRAHESETWSSLEAALTCPKGPIRDFAAHSLLARWIDDFDRVREKLLAHPDLEIRYAVAERVVRIGFRDGAVFDVLETPGAVRNAFERWVGDAARLATLTDALVEAALADHGCARVFTYATLVSPSSWSTPPLRAAALRALSMAAYHGADVRRAIVPLLALGDFELLERIARKSRARAAEIHALLSPIEKFRLHRPEASEALRKLARYCRTRMRKIRPSPKPGKDRG